MTRWAMRRPGSAPQAAGTEDGLRRRSPVKDARLGPVPGLVARPAGPTMFTVPGARVPVGPQDAAGPLSCDDRGEAEDASLPFRILGEDHPEAGPARVRPSCGPTGPARVLLVPRRSLQVGQLPVIMARTSS